MSSTAHDTSAALRSAIADALRSHVSPSFVLRELVSVCGGNTNPCWRASDGTQSYFVKTAAADDAPRLHAEAGGLAALRTCRSLYCPEVLGLAVGADFAALILEHLDLQPLASAQSGRIFAHALADLHTAAGETRYGWEADNYLGRSLQANRWEGDWARFWARHRLQPQLERARNLPALRGEPLLDQLLRDGALVLERVSALFLDFRPQPVLLHGDLWHGNVGTLADGSPVIFDPACYFGDREADLAMAELFGGFPDSFYATYWQRHPPSAEGHLRKTLYQLYHVLNHLNLFGRSYLGQAQRMMHSLERAIRRV